MDYSPFSASLNALVQTNRAFYRYGNFQLYEIHAPYPLQWALENDSVDTAKRAMQMGADLTAPITYRTVQTLGIS